MKLSSLILDILGSWHPKPVPARHIVKVGELFGFKENAIRVALRRLCLNDKAIPTKAQSRSCYALTQKIAVISRHIRDACVSPLPQKTWSGTWTQLLFSVPEAQKSERRLAQKRLQTLRFASPYRGCWMRPDNLEHSIQKIRTDLNELGISGQVEILHSQFADPQQGKEMAARLWDLPLRAQRMRTLFTEVNNTIQAFKKMPLKEALVRSFAQNRQVVKVLARDPALPSELLPKNWPGQRLRHIYPKFSKTMMQGWHTYASQHEQELGLTPDDIEEVFAINFNGIDLFSTILTHEPEAQTYDPQHIQII